MRSLWPLAAAVLIAALTAAGPPAAAQPQAAQPQAAQPPAAQPQAAQPAAQPQAAQPPAAQTDISQPAAGPVPVPDPPSDPDAGDPDTAPPGSNDFSCALTEDRPNPVVLVHGTFANQATNWDYLSPLLAEEGYCVFSLTYGLKDNITAPGHTPGGLTRMQDSADELAEFVDLVLDETGAEQVDLLGHSQGSLMPSHYVRFLDGASSVDNYVSLTPLWEGTALLGLATLYAHAETLGVRPTVDLALDQVCESCPQFLRGSDYLKELHSIGTFDPEVTYTNIVTRFDELVVPFTSGIAEGENITNIVLQDECARDFSGHAGVAFNPHAAGHILAALDPEAAEEPTCQFVSTAGAR